MENADRISLSTLGRTLREMLDASQNDDDDHTGVERGCVRDAARTRSTPRTRELR